MKLTKNLSEFQRMKLNDLIYEEMTVDEVRILAADFLVSEGFDKEEVEEKILNPKEVVAGKLRATSVWCIMFPWFC